MIKKPPTINQFGNFISLFSYCVILLLLRVEKNAFFCCCSVLSTGVSTFGRILDAGNVKNTQTANVHDRPPFPGRKYVTLWTVVRVCVNVTLTVLCNVYRILMWKIFELE